METKAVFLDRDGTINEDRSYITKPEEFVLIPGALEALKMLNEKGIRIYIITNQAGIAKGLYTENDYHAVTRHMLKLFAENGVRVDEVIHCPHHAEGSVTEYAVKCSCRKPATGMLERVIAENGYKPEEMALIGDKNSDIEAGQKLGIATFLVETGYGKDHKKETKADNVVPNLLNGVQKLLGRNATPS